MREDERDVETYGRLRGEEVDAFEPCSMKASTRSSSKAVCRGRYRSTHPRCTGTDRKNIALVRAPV
jgi:hypothetical protein